MVRCPSQSLLRQTSTIARAVESLLETIELDIEEASELTFKVKIEGIDPAPARVRLVCETADMSLMFDGRPIGKDLVRFELPSLAGRLKEGSYASRVEVLIENRYFAPVRFNLGLKKAVNVVAEAVDVTGHRQQPAVKITALPIAARVIDKSNRDHIDRLPKLLPTLKERYAARGRS